MIQCSVLTQFNSIPTNEVHIMCSVRIPLSEYTFLECNVYNHRMSCPQFILWMFSRDKIIIRNISNFHISLNLQLCVVFWWLAGKDNGYVEHLPFMWRSAIVKGQGEIFDQIIYIHNNFVGHMEALLYPTIYPVTEMLIKLFLFYNICSNIATTMGGTQLNHAMNRGLLWSVPNTKLQLLFIILNFTLQLG